MVCESRTDFMGAPCRGRIEVNEMTTLVRFFLFIAKWYAAGLVLGLVLLYFNLLPGAPAFKTGPLCQPSLQKEAADA